jgi:hypothetical protein
VFGNVGCGAGFGLCALFVAPGLESLRYRMYRLQGCTLGDGLHRHQRCRAGRIAEPIARQTPASTKNVANDDLSWFAIEVVE